MGSAETAYLFRHTMLRDTAYELQLPTVRARLHTIVLQIFERMYGGAPPAAVFKLGEDLEAEPHPLDPLAAELAEHALRGQGLTTNLHEMRLMQEHYLLRAVWSAERHYYNAEALALWLSLSQVARMDHDNAREAAYLCHASVAAILAGRPELGVQLAEQATATAGPDAEPKLRGAVLGRLGRAQRELGKPELSLATMRQADGLLTSAGEHRLALGVRVSIAIVLREIGRIDESESLNDSIAESARELGALKLLGNAIGNQVGVYLQSGRSQMALEAATQALAIHRQIANRRSEGITLGNLASLQRAAGAFEQAEQTFAEALAINREVGDKQSEGRALSNLGNLHVALGRLDLAEPCFKQSIGILRELGIRRDHAVALGNYATLLTQMGRLADAEIAFLEALPLHRQVGNTRHEGAHLMDYAGCLVASARHQEAAKAWNEGARLVRQVGDMTLLAEKTAEMQATCAKAGVTPFK